MHLPVAHVPHQPTPQKACSGVTDFLFDIQFVSALFSTFHCHLVLRFRPHGIGSRGTFSRSHHRSLTEETELGLDTSIGKAFETFRA